MQGHIKTLGWMFLIYHAIAVMVGAFIFVLLSGIGVLSGEWEAAGVLGFIGVALAALLILLAAPGLIAGVGLLAQRSWARFLAIIIGCIHLLEFPIGTAFGVYTLWVLTHEDVIPAFRRA